MEIKQFVLDNIGHFKHLEVPLAPTEENKSNITVFIGNNGAGKTNILKSVATSLSWFVSRLRSEKGNGQPIPEEVILNNAPSAAVKVEVEEDKQQFDWIISKTRKGRKASQISDLSGVNQLTSKFREALTNNPIQQSLPLIVFYPVERVILDIPLKIRGKHSFEQIDGYDNALVQGVDFRRFFEWFREREDIENETSLPDDFQEKISQHISEIFKAKKKSQKQFIQRLERILKLEKDRQLSAVREAIQTFMPDFSNLKVRRKPHLHMSVDKNKKRLNVLQLSQGEKSLMALVGDIARRLAMMNPDLEKPLHGDGIVLIDEIDMHLHPTWQRSIIERLTATFPNCQFILSTHSPLVISDSKDILVYAIEDNKLNVLPHLYGKDVNSVLLDEMDTSIRNRSIEEKLNDLLDSIHNAKLDVARKQLTELEADLPENNIELTKARLMLRKQELRHAENKQRL